MLDLKRMLLFVWALMILISPCYSAPTTLTSVSNPGLDLLPQAHRLSPINAGKIMHFTVHLKIRNQKKFYRLFKDIYDPNHPAYHQYLTKAEYESKFAPDKSTLALVQQYLNDGGLNTKIVGDNIEVTASVGKIEQFLKVKMNHYQYQNKTVYSNSSAPKIDAKIAQYILGITGLNNIPRFHRMVLSAPHANTTTELIKPNVANQHTLLNLAWNSFTPQALPTDTSLNGFTGEQLRKTYNIDAIPTVDGTTINGAGQTIVILDEWGRNDPATILADANYFNSVNNLPLFSFTSTPGQPANFAVVDTHGDPYAPTHNEPNQGWSDEIAIDLSASHTIASNANIVLVLNNNLDLSTILTTIFNSGDYSFAGFPNAYVISNSWGAPEYTDSILEMNLQRAAMSGMSVNFSSSDCGDGSYNSSWPCSSSTNPPIIEYPASSPYATAVGGSSLFVDMNYNYAFESGWGSYVSGAFYAGSTGGISQHYSAPTWQDNTTFQGFTAGGYGVIGDYLGGGMRAVPDVTMLADLYTGILSYYSHGCDPPNACIFGGTSVACPLYSGTLTLINQARMLQKKPTIGLSAQYLYTQHQVLVQTKALKVITPPHQIISNQNTNPIGAPKDAFTLFSSFFNQPVTFNWDSSLTINEDQYWNDVVGVGSPNLPIFIPFMTAQ